MKITIRNPVRQVVELHGKRRVRELLRELDLNPESHLVVRDRELLTSDDLLLDEDHVEVLSTISGGSQCGA